MASDRAHTPDGTPIGGWVLRADPAIFDVEPMLEAYGQVFRYPLAPSDRVELLEPGTPCFLFRSDTSKVVGIWAVGEVVAPAFEAPIDQDDPGAGTQFFAEVELLPLDKPIAAGKLKDLAPFADGELLTSPDQPNPIVLRPEEVRAIEELEFTIVEPTEEQVARLEEVLGAEDDGADDGGLVFQLLGIEDSYGIRLDGDEDGLLSVFTINADGAFELGRFEDFADAVDLISLRAADLELPEPVAPGTETELPDGEPVALLDTDDGLLAIYRTAEDRFDLYDPDPAPEDDVEVDTIEDLAEPEHLGSFGSLADVLAALAEAVEEVDED